MPPCSGAAVMTRPSAVSAQSPPRRVDLGAQRGQPVGLVAAQMGDTGQPRHRAGRGQRGQRRHRRAPARRRRAGRRRSPGSRRRPATSRYESVMAHSRSDQLRGSSRMVSAGCTLTVGQPAMRTVPPVTAAAARNGTEFDRSGSIGPVPRRDRAGLHPPLVGRGVVDVDAGLAQHRHRHRDVRGRRHRRPGVHHRQPVGEGGAGQQQARRRTARTPTRRCRTVPPRTAPRPRTENGSPVPVDVDAEAAQRVEQRGDRAGPGPARRRRTRPPRCSTRPAAARTAAPCRPARSRCGRRASGASAPLTVRSVPLAVDARGRGVCSAPIIRSVSRLRSAPLIVEAAAAPAAASAARISARLVCDFEPGTVTVACTGVGCDRCRPQLGAHGYHPALSRRLPLWRHVRTIRGHHRPGPAGREDPGHRRGDRRGGGDSRAQLQRRPDRRPSPPWSSRHDEPEDDPDAAGCG